MLSPAVLYTTAALMALVAAACTALCLAWSVPEWRNRLAPTRGAPEAPAPVVGGLSGWQARVGGGLVSAGIGAAAVIAWGGLYFVLAAI